MEIGDVAELIRHGVNPNKLRNAQIQLGRVKFSLKCANERDGREEDRLRWLRDEVGRIAPDSELSGLDAEEMRQMVEEIQEATMKSRQLYPWNE